jgi:hypothetical protein
MFGYPAEYTKLKYEVKNMAVSGKNGQSSNVQVGFKVRRGIAEGSFRDWGFCECRG